MTPFEFVRSIYLGDRSCKEILILGWENEIKIKVDAISRVRGDQWNYYSDEDVIDGFIVFEGAVFISFDPPGCIPNDIISAFDVYDMPTGEFKFILRINSGKSINKQEEVTIIIIANDICIENEEKRIRI